jgi:outer membrane protein, heavy metal efflux system
MSPFPFNSFVGRVVRLTGIAAAAGASAFCYSQSLDLPTALSRAARENPALLASSVDERIADARVEQASVRPNPSLDVELENFLGTGDLRGARALEGTVQVSQTIERGGKRRHRVAMAESERAAAIAQHDLRRHEIFSALAVAYMEVLAAQARVQQSEEPARLAQETLQAVNLRYQSGMGSPAEVARARAATTTAALEQTRARASLSAARSKLAAFWGEQSLDADVKGTLNAPAALPDRAQLLSKIEAHPQLRWQRAQFAARDAALEVERSRGVQDFSVGAGLRLLRPEDDAALVASVSIPLPVHDRNQGAIRAARESLNQAELEVRAAEAELRADFTSAWGDLSAAHEIATRLRSETLPQVEEAQSTVRAAYDQGMLPLIDVLEAQRSLSGVRREILEADVAYAAALARLEGLIDPTFPLTLRHIIRP